MFFCFYFQRTSWHSFNVKTTLGRPTKCITWLSSPTSTWKWQKIGPFLQRCPCRTTSTGKTWIPLCPAVWLGAVHDTILESLTPTQSLLQWTKDPTCGLHDMKTEYQAESESRSVVSDSLWPHGPASSIHGILWARMLKCAALSFSRGSSWPRDRTQVSCIAGRLFTIWATRENIRLRNINSFCPFSTSGHVMAHRGDGKFHLSLLVGILEEESPVIFCEGRRKVLLCEDLLLTPSRKFPLIVLILVLFGRARVLVALWFRGRLCFQV